MEKKPRKYRGRLSQVFIYLGKLFRMFIYQSDWKVIPMAAIISGLVTFAVGQNLFKTQEGTLQGCFALVCVCVWNGFFNSIQVICRERPIIKREHRAGMFICSYILSHMVYQVFICAIQTVITFGVCYMADVSFPSQGLVTGSFLTDFAISLFLITYTADMMSLAISSLVHNTTTAMTVMPFMLIFQLLFSGGLVQLEGDAQVITNLTVAKWGLVALCTLGNYNSLPMVSLWNMVFKFRDMDILGGTPVAWIMDQIMEEGELDNLLLAAGQFNQKADYLFAPENLLKCWGTLLFMTVLFAVLAGLFLTGVDKDKR